MKNSKTKPKKSQNESLIDQAAEQWVNITLQHAQYNRNKKDTTKIKKK